MNLKNLSWTLLFVVPAGLWGQWTGSGSTGADGALNITSATPGVVGGVYIFDPVALNIDTDGDNVYHFTTVSIATGLSVYLRANKMRRNGPVVWLATGNVTLNGPLFIRGESGHPGGTDFSLRKPSTPGPGGYPGGVGGRQGTPPSQGFGPGRGNPPTGAAPYGCNAGHSANGTSNGANTACAGQFGTAYGTNFVLPLVGGSGASGAGCTVAGQFGGGGGAGAGAIRISTNGSVSMTNWIYADGGNGGSGCFTGGGGSGGSIHIQAGGGTGTLYLDASGGTDAYSVAAAAGRIRIDTPTGIHSGGGIQTPTPLVGPLINVPLPIIPTVRVTAVDGIAVPTSPQAIYTIPDLAINKTTPVTVNLAAVDVPLGTQLTLIITTEGFGITDQVVTSTALAGTLANSTATATVTFPQGVQRFFARAVW